ncbi:MAG: NAD(+) diphosphatase [Parvularculaceae bacterium]
MLNNPNYFTGNPLDRASDKRKDETFVATQLAHEEARMAVFWRGQPLMTTPIEDATESFVLWLHPDSVSQFKGAGTPLFLGLKDATPYFALDVSASAPEAEIAPFSEMGVYGQLREFGLILPRDELAILGQAAWLIDWHRRNRFCPRTGAPTKIGDGGAKRVEPKAERDYFPRIDPVAIVLPTHDDHCLLGRSPHFPPAMYSALAGFMEPGESLEECAAREIFEEAGVVLSDISYQFSQPWPFPASLMVGFLATAQGKEITLDKEELEDARWVTRGEVQALLKGERRDDLWLPPKFAIARQLLEVWAGG